MGTNIPFSWTVLSLFGDIRRRRHDGYGRYLGIQPLNPDLDLTPNRGFFSKAFCSKIPLFCENRKWILHHCWLPWKVQMSQWYLVNWCQLTSHIFKTHIYMERKKSKRKHLSHPMGTLFQCLQWKNIYIWRALQ